MCSFGVNIVSALLALCLLLQGNKYFLFFLSGMPNDRKNICDDLQWSNDYLKFVSNLEDIWKKIIPTQGDMVNHQCWYSSKNFDREVQRHLESWEILYSNFSIELNEKVLSMSNMNTCINKTNSCSNMFCLPQVVLGGFPKAGTTTLYNLIISHPSIAKPLLKERHFWREYIRKPRYPEFHITAIWTYLYNFKKATSVISKKTSHLFTIDGSASTVFAGSNYGNDREVNSCIAPMLFSRLLPKTKFIFIVRNPGDRLWSDFWYTCSKKSDRTKSENSAIMFDTLYKNGPKLFHKYVLLEINKFNNCINLTSDYLGCIMAANSEVGAHAACKSVRLGLSIYYYHLIKWYNLFDNNQILILLFENFVNNVSNTMKKVWNFLDVNEIHPSQIVQLMKEVDQNSLESWIENMPRHSFKMLPETRNLLNSFFRPYNLKLVTLLNDSEFLW